MDNEALLKLWQARYDELVADPTSATAATVEAMKGATTQRHLLTCLFGEHGVATLDSVFGGDHEGQSSALPVLVSNSLGFARTTGYPLHTLAEGLLRDLSIAAAQSVSWIHQVRGDSRVFEQVVHALAPPCHSMVMPADVSDWPRHAGSIQYVLPAGSESEPQGEAAKDALTYYTREMRRRVTRPVSVWRCIVSKPKGLVALCKSLADHPKPYVVSEEQQSLLRALSEAKTAQDFLITLAGHDNEQHFKTMEQYLTVPDGVQTFDDFLLETFNAEIACFGSCRRAGLGYSRLRTAVPGLESLPELVSPAGSVSDIGGRDGDQDMTTGDVESDDEDSTVYDSELEDGIDLGADCDGAETHIWPSANVSAFSRNSAVWHHLNVCSPGRVGIRDLPYRGTIPCPVRELGSQLTELAMYWHDTQKDRLSSESPLDSEPTWEDVQAAGNHGVDRWSKLLRKVGRARTEARTAYQSATRSDTAASQTTHVRTKEPIFVMPSIHKNDSDRHDTVGSFLSGLATKLRNGWYIVEAVYEDVTDRSTTSQPGSSQPTKRALPEGREGTEDPSKRSRADQ